MNMNILSPKNNPPPSGEKQYCDYLENDFNDAYYILATYGDHILR
jgi:hypothetical protein